MSNHAPGKWTYEYDNDGNGGYSAWYNIMRDGCKVGESTEKKDAEYIAAACNAYSSDDEKDEVRCAACGNVTSSNYTMVAAVGNQIVGPLCPSCHIDYHADYLKGL